MQAAPRLPPPAATQLAARTRQASRRVSLPTLFRQRGMGGGMAQLYRGLAPTLALDLPFALVQLPAFEHLKRRFGADDDAAGGGAAGGSVRADALAGAAAGGLAAALTTPLDVLRTRHVLRSAGGGGDPSFLATARHILRAEGMRGLLRGVVPRTVYMSLGGVLYLGTYSTVCRVWS